MQTLVELFVLALSIVCAVHTVTWLIDQDGN